MQHNSISRKPQVCLFLPLVKTQAPFLMLVVCYESCVAAMGAAFFVRGFGCALFIWEADAKEKAYLIESLFDRINESDALEEELLDIHANRKGIRIVMKDGTVFLLSLAE